jgi:hypothetical protein
MIAVDVEDVPNPVRKVGVDRKRLKQKLLLRDSGVRQTVVLDAVSKSGQPRRPVSNSALEICVP